MLTTDRAVLIRYRRDGRSRRGSGLRIGGRLVLTAAHCANGSDHEIVVGGREYPASVVVRSDSPGADLAVLQADDLPEVDVLGCARVDRQRAAEVSGCQALGFPSWKDGAQGPRLAQVKGLLPTAEGIEPQRAGEVPALTLRITDQQIREPVSMGDLDQPGSPWAGMSGAVVVTEGDQIVGVVRSHSLAEGVGALTLAPLDGIDRLPQETARRFWDALHVVDPSTLLVLPVLPPLPAGLQRAAEVAHRYAPEHLRDRDDWIAELTRFAAGPAGCCWVYGDPWAGKTALLAGFVTKPHPASVVVVSHFVPAADPRRNTSVAFLEAMVDQLAAVAGSERDRQVDQVAEFSRLLGAAAESCARAKKALVLVVDGLDQDRSWDRHLPSIGALLLRRPPESVHILVASRRDYRIPDDVDAASTLRDCPKLELPATPYVRELLDRAESELRDQAKDKTGRELLRYLTAAGAALDPGDLAELTGIEEPDIDEHISGHLGRSLRHVTPSGSGYVFAHEVLQTTASDRYFRHDLPAYRAKIRAWADRRRSELAGRWPIDETPVFLLEGYRYFLKDCPDGVDALATLLEDRKYQKAMRNHYGWLDEYVRDIEWVADRDPGRAARLCLRSLEGMFPNSLLRRRLLDLLIRTSPKSDSRQARGALNSDINRIVEMFRKPEIDRGDVDWLIDRYEQAKEKQSVRPALLVLAMGRICEPRLRDKLLQIFQSPIRGVNWAAADALLEYWNACNDQALADDVIRFCKETSNWTEREHGLYVLAGMRTPQAREIAVEALDSRHSGAVGQALRILQGIPLTAHDLDRLLGLLQRQVSEIGPQGPWRDDWVRKRLIRAIHQHRDDLTPDQKRQARDLIAQLAAAVAGQPVRDATKRRLLLRAIDNARQDIGP